MGYQFFLFIHNFHLQHSVPTSNIFESHVQLAGPEITNKAPLTPSRLIHSTWTIMEFMTNRLQMEQGREEQESTRIYRAYSCASLFFPSLHGPFPTQRHRSVRPRQIYERLAHESTLRMDSPPSEKTRCYGQTTSGRVNPKRASRVHIP